MITQQNIRMLIDLFNSQNNILAVNKLWEFYFPLLQQLALQQILKYNLEDDAEDNEADALWCLDKALEDFNVG